MQHLLRSVWFHTGQTVCVLKIKLDMSKCFTPHQFVNSYYSASVYHSGVLFGIIFLLFFYMQNI